MVTIKLSRRHDRGSINDNKNKTIAAKTNTPAYNNPRFACFWITPSPSQAYNGYNHPIYGIYAIDAIICCLCSKQNCLTTA